MFIETETLRHYLKNSYWSNETLCLKKKQKHNIEFIFYDFYVVKTSLQGIFEGFFLYHSNTLFQMLTSSSTL